MNKLILLLLCSFILLNCKTTKKISQGPPPSRSKDEILSKLKEKNFNFKYCNIKGVADLNSSQFSGSGSFNVRIKYDSIIWIQVKKLSLEGVRAVILLDSFHLINRLDHSFISESIQSLQVNFGVIFDYHDLQSLVTSNPILPDIDDFISYNQFENNCILNATNQSYNLTYIFDAYQIQLKSISISDKIGHKIDIEYANYQKINKKFLPMNIDINFTSQDDFKGSARLNIKEYEFDIEKSFNFSIPSHYTKVKF